MKKKQLAKCTVQKEPSPEFTYTGIYQQKDGNADFNMLKHGTKAIKKDQTGLVITSK